MAAKRVVEITCFWRLANPNTEGKYCKSEDPLSDHCFYDARVHEISLPGSLSQQMKPGGLFRRDPGKKPKTNAHLAQDPGDANAVYRRHGKVMV